MTVLTQYPPGFPPGDTSTATPGEDAIDVGRIILNPNWSTNRQHHAIEPPHPAHGPESAGRKASPA